MHYFAIVLEADFQVGKRQGARVFSNLLNECNISTGLCCEAVAFISAFCCIHPLPSSLSVCKQNFNAFFLKSWRLLIIPTSPKGNRREKGELGRVVSESLIKDHSGALVNPFFLECMLLKKLVAIYPLTTIILPMPELTGRLS